VTDLTLSNINDFVGRELGVSGWMTVDQARINQFADCTGDHQWIHVDVDRAKRESPFRSAVAHGYLTLSLIAPLAMEIGVLPTDARLWTISDSLYARAREAEWELGTFATDKYRSSLTTAEITTLHEISWMRPRVPPTPPM
jgi:acyl dehydratase